MRSNTTDKPIYQELDKQHEDPSVNEIVICTSSTSVSIFMKNACYLDFYCAAEHKTKKQAEATFEKWFLGLKVTGNSK